MPTPAYTGSAECCSNPYILMTSSIGIIRRCSRRGCRIQKAGMEHDLSLTSRVELDVLLLNIEAASKVNRRTEFFAWVQGVFQGVIGHEIMICGLALPGMSSLSFDWVGAAPIAAEQFAELCSSDQGL